jgi:hypothetical protein
MKSLRLITELHIDARGSGGVPLTGGWIHVFCSMFWKVWKKFDYLNYYLNITHIKQIDIIKISVKKFAIPPTSKQFNQFKIQYQ